MGFTRRSYLYVAVSGILQSSLNMFLVIIADCFYDVLFAGV